MLKKHETPPNPLLQIAWVTKKQGCTRAVMVSFGNAALILTFMRSLHVATLWKTAKMLLGLLTSR
ncbi:MAG TPA: hypothetical protein VN948_14305 [Terriglobales bacterium]|nr:hypothetical protein [Terriglobales bacterium]